MARTLTVEIIGDARSLNRALDSTQRTTKGFSSKIANLGKVAAGAAGAAGIGALIFGVKAGISEFKESQEVTAQTVSVLKSMGKTAGVTAKDVTGLATSIMKKTGIDDEAIQSGENLLLTFRNIRNQVGKNNDIFTQATKITTDFSVRFGKSIPQSAVLVGKALNDPIKGLTALNRVGVQFDSGQKQLIKDLVEGRKAIDTVTMGFDNLSPAQTEQATKLAKLGFGWQDIADQLNLKYTPAQKKAFDFMEAGGHTIQAQKIIMKELSAETKGAAEAYGKTLPGMISIARESFNNWAGDLVAKMIPAIQTTVSWIRDHWPEISAVIKRTWNQDIKPTITALIELVRAVVVVIRNNWGTIGPIVKTFAAIIETNLKIVIAIVRTLTALLRGDWSQAWQQAKQVVFLAIDAIRQRLVLLGQIGKALGSALVQGFVAAINAGWGLVKAGITGLFHKVIGWAKDALGIGSPSKVFHDIGTNVVKGFANGVGSAAGLLRSAVLNLVKSLPSKALGALGGLLGGGATSVKPGKGGSTLGTLVPWANSEGMQITSTTGGTHVKGSYHYQGRAIDVVGSAGQMRKFFFDSLEHFGGAIKELFYDPVGEYVKNGKIIRGSIGGHSDHVHLALGEGGIVTRPTMALVGEKGPEAVIPLGRRGGPMQVNLNVDGKTLASILIDPLRNEARLVSQRTGRPVFG